MKKFDLYGQVKDGKLSPRLRANLINAFKLMDGDIHIEIENWKAKRTNSQNAFLWAAIYPQVQEGLRDMGNELTLKEVHDLCRSQSIMMNEVIVNPESGQAISTMRSTTKLSKEQFAEYIDDICRFAAEFLNLQIQINESAH